MKNESLKFTEELWVQKTHANGKKDPPVLLSTNTAILPPPPKEKTDKELLDLGLKLLALGAIDLACRWVMGPQGIWMLATITTAGVSYMATDLASASASPSIGAFRFHDSGTGTTPATIADTGLETPTGIARVAGTGSNPSATQYQSEATIVYDNTYNITEWVLMSALVAGSCWSHRVFSAQPVVNLDALTFRYPVNINAGG